jgi:exopolyphosphatase / guanosine-5'-triphosphate,3'-diphosphate pyrophosphatase
VDSGGGIRTRDLRVMSPTSYLTAPPRVATARLPTGLGNLNGRSRAFAAKCGTPPGTVTSVSARRVGVIDQGTNSTRLLVADVHDGRVTEIERQTNVTRLGDGLEASGRLSDAAIERVVDAVAGYRELLDRHGAETVVCVATSAMRDAENGQQLADILRERFQVDPRVISGDEEARLTFLGATNGRPPSEPTLVFDIGGGSTEYVVGHPGSDPTFHISTRMGSVRHTERHLHNDPPNADELTALAGDVDSVIAGDVPADIRADVHQAIAVAGTATSLAAIDLQLDPYDPRRVDGHRLTRERCEQLRDRLASLPLAERRQVAGLHPDRAPTIVAGATILARSLHAFQLEEVEVSEADILHGAALQSAENGPS